MEHHQSHANNSIPNPNPNPRNNGTNHQSNKKKMEFEYCKVCKLNNDQGRRHNYFPNHSKSLSSLLSRFQAKLTDLKFFLTNPTLIHPQHASPNPFWCVFCDSQVHDLSSSFACGNAITHLASADHLKNLKCFLWKYGGGMDRVDSLRISEADLAKWEKKCKLLTSEVPSEGSHGPFIGPLNDIHNELNSEYIDTFEKNNIHALNSSFSNGVVPLQIYTNEKYQVSHSGLSRVTEAGPSLHDANSYFYHGPQCDTNQGVSMDLTGYVDSQHSVLSSGRICSSDGYINNVKVYGHERTANGESSCQGLQSLTQIFTTVQGEAIGNVHSGAPPPWLDATDKIQPDLVSLPNKSGKSSKLNPRRVGAAWAERRKIELEMEKRGELVTNNFDANWLPNFGRVWQSGTRRESRKEFEVENKKSSEVESWSEVPVKLQPYVSKRMRREASEQCFGD